MTPAAVASAWGGAGRVMVDLGRLRGLVAAVRAAGEVLRSAVRSLVWALSLLGMPVVPAARLDRVGAALDAEATLLAGRVTRAEEADGLLPARTPHRWRAAAEASVRSGIGDLTARAAFGRGPTATADSTVAQAAGRAAARLLSRAADQDAATGAARTRAHPDARSGRRLGIPAGAGRAAAGPARAAAEHSALDALSAAGDHADFIAGFFDELGPAGLASLLTALVGRPPLPLGHRPTPPTGLDPRRDVPVLGRAFAAYSRLRSLDDVWLGQFNTLGRTDRADVVLLRPLLGAGRLDPGLLDRLGRLAFGAGREPPGGTRGRSARVDTPPPAAASGGLRPLPPRPGRPGATELVAYQVALLDAITVTPSLVAHFAVRHLGELLGVASVGALGLPVRTGLSEQATTAWSRLIATAGSQSIRRADPAGSATFVTGLARAADTAGGSSLPPRLRTAFVPALHTYADEIYDTVTAVVPGQIAPAESVGPVGPVGPAGALRAVPATAWRALLREGLRGGAMAGLLGRDAAAFGTRLEEATAERTQGWNRTPAGLPASPRTLSYLRAVRAQAFFAEALGDAADAVVREHAEAGAEHRRQQAVLLDLLGTVATSIDLRNPAGTFEQLGVGVTVVEVEAMIRERYRDAPSAESRRILADLRAATAAIPRWSGAYEESARLLWRRRAGDPLRPVTVTEADGRRRAYTGDPRQDGYITGPATDFLDPTGVPRPAAAMTPAQRGAYLAWLESPAMVANNDRLPVLAGMAGGAEPAPVPPDRVLRPGG